MYYISRKYKPMYYKKNKLSVRNGCLTCIILNILFTQIVIRCNMIIYV